MKRKAQTIYVVAWLRSAPIAAKHVSYPTTPQFPRPHTCPKMAQIIPTSLTHLVQLIHAELGTDKGLGHVDVNVDRVKALMAAYKSNEDDWQQFALW